MSQNNLEIAVKMLEDNGLNNDENRAIVVAGAYPRHIAAALSYLHGAGILTPKNREVIAGSADPSRLAYGVIPLHGAEILTQANFDVVAGSANPRAVADCLVALKNADILTQENRVIVAGHARPEVVAAALIRLKDAGILTQANFDVVAGSANPRAVAAALIRLKDAGILTQENRAIVAGHVYPETVAAALIRLKDAGILTQENRAIVVGHDMSMDIAFGLAVLKDAGFLEEANNTMITQHAHPQNAIYELTKLHSLGILNQENFNALLSPNHTALLSEYGLELFGRMPRHLFTQQNFQRLLTASEQAYPITVLEAVVNEILGIGAAVAPQQQFNPAQSTHTASVHDSVSKSAGNLMTAYGDKIQGGDLDKAINEIKAYVNQLDNSPKHKAATRAIERLTQPHYIFTDTSGVSTRQLLALAWLAIHDDSKRQGDLSDAQTLFVEGLYEIQRGYNLNEVGVDNNSPNDSSICSAGTFNKIMEKLVGIHPDSEVIFITKEGAATKLQVLAEHHTLTYLKELASRNPKDASELIKALKEAENLEPIWKEIEEHVKTKLWDEFKEAYGNNPENQHFQDYQTSIRIAG